MSNLGFQAWFKSTEWKHAKKTKESLEAKWEQIEVDFAEQSTTGDGFLQKPVPFRNSEDLSFKIQGIDKTRKDLKSFES